MRPPDLRKRKEAGVEEIFFSLTFIHSLKDAVGRGEGCICGRICSDVLTGFFLDSQSNHTIGKRCYGLTGDFVAGVCTPKSANVALT